VKEGDSNLFRRETTTINSQDVLCSSAGFQRVELIRFAAIVPNIATFFFTLQSSAFWPFKRPKQRRLMTANIYIKKVIGSHLGGPGPGSTGFRLANSQAGFCLHRYRSQARVGRVPSRPARPVRVLKL
jgi:hypothetical protein